MKKRTIQLVDRNDDTLIVKKILEGNIKYFEILYKTHAKMMINASYRIVQKREEAEDIVQEIFIKLKEKLKTFQHRSTLATWLRRIVINESINALKKRKTVPLYEPHLYNKQELFDNRSFFIENQENEIAKKKIVNTICKAINNLPSGYRIIVSLYMIDNYNHKAIASLLGIAESTVRTQYIRGKKKLIESLKNKL